MRRYWFRSLGAVLFALLAMMALYQADQFLAADPRFTLPGASEYGEETSGLRIEGVVYAPRASVIHVFQTDFGRSLYLLPLAERRQNLLGVDWVEDASVSRLWPNRAAVRIRERRPVAFVQLLASGGLASFRIALVDAHGVILEAPPRARFTLPVVSGILREQSESIRRDRVRRMLRLTQELGPLAANISEIDVSDPENLKVTEPIDGRAVVLLLGNQDFLPRLKNFLNHYPEIRRRLANATTFDLRLEDRITAVEGTGHGG